MNAIEQMLASAMSCLGKQAGRELVANTGERINCLVEDIPILPDPDQPAQAKVPVYVRLHAVATDVIDPRLINRFTDAGGRFFKVLKYEETSQNVWETCWMCEAQRK